MYYNSQPAMWRHHNNSSVCSKHMNFDNIASAWSYNKGEQHKYGSKRHDGTQASTWTQWQKYEHDMITNYTNNKCKHEVEKLGKGSSCIYKHRSVLGFKAQQLHNKSLEFGKHCLHILVCIKSCMAVIESMVDNVHMKFMLDNKEHCHFWRCEKKNYQKN